MAQVVQASCPGCKSILRIPTEWLHQPIRCKACGTVVQARGGPAPVAGTPTTAASASETTPPPTRNAKVAVPPPPPLPVGKSPGFPHTPAPPAHPGYTTPSQPAPLAAPVGAASGSPFDFEEPEVATASPRRKRKRGSGMGPLLVFFGLLVVLLGLGIAFRDQLRASFNYLANNAPLPNQGDGGTNVVKPDGPGKDNVPVGASQFPRRAMIISVHNYLYANPVPEGVKGSTNIEFLIAALSNNLRIPLNQIIHISDAAKKEPRPPLKNVIEESLTNFLKTCRKQDRILVFFVGHGKEVNDEAYLVPIEGEYDNAETLIPLKWVYDQLASCPARQKILVLDANRFNSAQGEERPSAGPMGAKFEAMVKAPPAGVQVMASCSAGEQSNEFEDVPLGLYLDSFRQAIDPSPEGKAKSGLAGSIQKPNDLIPVESIHKALLENMAGEMARRKVKQVALQAGSAPGEGADFDRTEGPAKQPALPVLAATDVRVVKEILSEVSLPPLKGGENQTTDVSFTMLPPFPAEVLNGYRAGDLPADAPLRKAVEDARVALWAVSTAQAPADIAPAVAAFRKKVGVDMSIMKDRYGKPGAGPLENRFKEGVMNDQREMSKIVARLEAMLDKLKEVKDDKDAAPKRWQANYMLILARFQAQLAYLEEYQSLLGSMRKEFPEHDPAVHSGWKMASKEKASDNVGKKLDKAARTLYADLAKENPKTPYEVLAKREKMTALGLEWKAY